MTAPAPERKRRSNLYWILLAAVAIPGAYLAYMTTSGSRPPTIDEYLAAAPGRVARADAAFKVGGRSPFCDRAPVVLDAGLDDVAAAHPGFIILNPGRLATLPDVIQLYAYGHECGHQVVGAGEDDADCWAIGHGKADGWLNSAGIDTICVFWQPYAGDNAHLPGSERCRRMRQCFAAAPVKD